MKNLLIILIALLPLVSCVSKKDAQMLQSQKDSLAMELANKDSLINDVFSSLNDITENLNTIKSRERIITSSVAGNEIRKEATVQIREDIAAIDSLIQANKNKVARLERSVALLKKANVRIASLENLIKELNLQIEEKNKDIASLHEELKQKNVTITNLNEKVTNLDAAVGNLSQSKNKLEGEVRTKTDMLNTAYYIIGSEKELISKEILYKSGFIGRTLKINENRSLDSFTQVDIRNFNQVLVGKKNVTLVSAHPAGSFELVKGTNNTVTEIVITDYNKFWELSKVLIVSYK